MREDLVFFLGGRDLEMATIRELLSEAKVPFHDRRLGWGARATDYRREIEEELAAGRRPVLVEVEDDLGLDPERALLVDHHGSQAGDLPSSLRQVFSLLGLPAERWDRWLDLVDANDRGHLRALARVGATSDEMRQVREADRRAQGITVAEEADAEEAVRRSERLVGGALTVVELPHGSTAAVADLLAPELGGTGYENLLILSPNEVNFFGAGDLIEALDREFPGGWRGGELPRRGFWGLGSRPAGMVEFLVSLLRSQSEVAESMSSVGSG